MFSKWCLRLFSLTFCALLYLLTSVPICEADTNLNTITFENKSGEVGLVKLIGPTPHYVEIPDNESRTVNVAPGRYYILTRYGSKPEDYWYSKGEPFDVTQTAIEYSIFTITLHKVVGGNYETKPVSADEFYAANVDTEKTDPTGQSLSSPNNSDPKTSADQHREGQSNSEYVLLEDPAAAAEWFLKKAEQGDAESQYVLAVMYRRGEGVMQDYEEAVKWLRKAAEQGHAVSQYELGVMHKKGYGVDQNHAEGLRWIRKAAEQGMPSAQYAVGVIYYSGQGVSMNFDEAIAWYHKAAEQGHVDAEYALGVCYYYGEGVSKDYSEAIKWYSKAAEQGNTKAQLSLGWIFSDGAVVDRDYVKAYMWLSIAAVTAEEANILDLATSSRNDLARQMKPSQISAANDLVNHWMAR